MPAKPRFDFSFEEIVSQASDSIIITDLEINTPGPRIVYVNHAFQELSGYTFDEVMGKSPRFLQGPDTDRASCEKIRQALTTHTPIRISLKNYTKDGKDYWIDVSILPLHDSKGKVTHFAAIQRDITEQKRNENMLDVLSKTDSLTGAINRRAFEDLLLKHYEKRHEEKCFVMMLDIDNFKSINDNFGHQVGDDYLKQFVSTIKTALRGNDLVSRLGGEEFCVLLSNLDQDKVIQIAQRVCSSIQSLSISNNHKKIITTVSIGISEVDSDDPSKKEVLARADAALYEAKREGKNRYKLFLSK